MNKSKYQETIMNYVGILSDVSLPNDIAELVVLQFAHLFNTNKLTENWIFFTREYFNFLKTIHNEKNYNKFHQLATNYFFKEISAPSAQHYIHEEIMKDYMNNPSFIDQFQLNDNTFNESVLYASKSPRDFTIKPACLESFIIQDFFNPQDQLVKSGTDNYLNQLKDENGIVFNLNPDLPKNTKNLHLSKRKLDNDETLTEYKGTIFVSNILLDFLYHLIRHLKSSEWFERKFSAATIRELLKIVKISDIAKLYLLNFTICSSSIKGITETKAEVSKSFDASKEFQENLLHLIIVTGIEVITRDNFCDFIENRFSYPVKSIVSSLLVSITRPEESLKLIKQFKEQISTILSEKTKVEWLYRFNTCLILKGFFESLTNSSSNKKIIFDMFKKDIINSLKLEDEIKIVCTEILCLYFDELYEDPVSYKLVISYQFENLENSDDIDGTSIVILEFLYNCFNHEVSFDALYKIKLSAILPFAFHKIDSVRAKCFNIINSFLLLFKNAEFSFQFPPNIKNSLPQVLQILFQALLMEDVVISKVIKKAIYLLLNLMEPISVYNWFMKNYNLIFSSLTIDKITNFQNFEFIQPPNFEGAIKYYDIIPEPITQAEKSLQSSRRIHYISRVIAKMSLLSPNMLQKILVNIKNTITNLDANFNTQVIFIDIFCQISKNQLSSLPMSQTEVKQIEGILLEFLQKGEETFKLSASDNDFFKRLYSFLNKYKADQVIGNICSNCLDIIQDIVNSKKNILQDPLKNVLSDILTKIESFENYEVYGSFLNKFQKLLSDFIQMRQISLYKTINLLSIASAALIYRKISSENSDIDLNLVIHPLFRAILLEHNNTFKLKFYYRVLVDCTKLMKNSGQVRKLCSNVLLVWIKKEVNILNENNICPFIKYYIKLYSKEPLDAHSGTMLMFCESPILKAKSSDYSQICNSLIVCQQVINHLSLEQSDFIQHAMKIITTMIIDLPEILKEKCEAHVENIYKLSLKIFKASYKINPEKFSFTVAFCTLRLIKEECNYAFILLNEFITSSADKYFLRFLPYFILPLLKCLNNFNFNPEQSVPFSTIIKIFSLNPTLMIQKIPKIEEKLFIFSSAEEGIEILKSLIDHKSGYNYPLNLPLKQSLRQYQLEGISWMAFHVKYNMNCALCDDMGLGKTIQTLSLILQELKLKTEQPIKNASNHSLIICPVTLKKNWVNEINKFFSKNDINYLLYSSKKDLHELDSSTNTIVIASYENVRIDLADFATIHWFFVILDEAQHIKNSKAKVTIAVKSLKADHKLILSGTPIQNNVLEIYSLFDFLMPGFLGDEAYFNKQYGKHLTTGIKKISQVNQESQNFNAALVALKKVISPFILRRVKSEVLSELPPKIVEDIICKPSEIQSIILNELNIAFPILSENISKDEVTNKKSSVFLNIMMHLRVCNHPSLFLEWKKVPEDFIELVKSKMPSSTIDNESACKISALEEILEGCGILRDQKDLEESITLENDALQENLHKALIFFQSKKTLRIIEEQFKLKHPYLNFLKIDSDLKPNERVEVGETFNTSPNIKILLSTTKIGGLGLNLTAADIVIFYDHDWNPMQDLQAMDRAHRIGQLHTVFVYRILCEDTIEEKILNIQRFKENLAKALVENEQTTSSSLELNNILSSIITPNDRKIIEEEKKKKVEERNKTIEQIARDLEYRGNEIE